VVHGFEGSCVIAIVGVLFSTVLFKYIGHEYVAGGFIKPCLRGEYFRS